MIGAAPLSHPSRRAAAACLLATAAAERERVEAAHLQAEWMTRCGKEAARVRLSVPSVLCDWFSSCAACCEQSDWTTKLKPANCLHSSGGVVKFENANRNVRVLCFYVCFYRNLHVVHVFYQYLFIYEVMLSRCLKNN